MRPDDAEVAANMEAYILALLRGDVQEAAAGAAAGAQGQGSGVESAAEPVNVPDPLLARVAQAVWRWLPPARPLLRGAARLFVARMLSGQQRVACELVALGPLAAELGLQRIDLLKVDAERAEMEVLSGLSAADWALVRQVVLEVHDLDDGEEGGAGAHTGAGTAALGALEGAGSQPAPPRSPQAEDLLRGQARQQKPGSEAGAGESSAVESCGLRASSAAPRGRLAAVQELLRAVGFAHVVCEQEPGLRGTTIYNVWATRA
ncbi:hypothetical protein HYH03_000625 [Edaphochlamys debaryana]|uniref:Methyltransferase FkbM domain-containing protein n=1 Tax=Edaphochlamys debaryana TaxID=47281 RepID=A0A836C7U6_9CHLO|nr:hypothetical protein HYH03_000625 [Edaphochlamys debaryana]|eukprot:KAG2502137.1 hypothetical protein HYH03_000625 [Edaphochlamys debaryana]